jgi:hypothetical protein
MLKLIEPRSMQAGTCPLSNTSFLDWHTVRQLLKYFGSFEFDERGFVFVAQPSGFVIGDCIAALVRVSQFWNGYTRTDGKHDSPPPDAS